jgi:catechol 2,3-dioxygenase-like lactoylglutathione lyase family enzyme
VEPVGDEAASPRLDHVGLNVRDLAAATEWYCRAFDLTVEIAFELDEIGLHIAMLHSPQGHRVELLHRNESRPGLRAANPVEAAATEGYGHICFDLPDLDAGYTAILAHGAEPVLAPQPSPEKGVRMAWVHDPEGNLIELIQRRQPEEI